MLPNIYKSDGIAAEKRKEKRAATAGKIYTKAHMDVKYLVTLHEDVPPGKHADDHGARTRSSLASLQGVRVVD